MSPRPLRKSDLVELHRELAQRRLVDGTSGNASIRCPGGSSIWIKASGAGCASLTKRDLVQTNLDGVRLNKKARAPSTDLALHLVIYKYFETTNCVIHTHSTFATIFSSIGKTMLPYVSGTAEFFPNGVPCVPYGTKRDEMAQALGINLKAARNACLLEKHGVIAWGRSTSEALSFAVNVEWSAQVAIFSTLLGGQPLSPQQRKDYFDWYRVYYHK